MYLLYYALVCFSHLLVLPVLQWGWKTCVTVDLTLCILCLRQQRVELAVHFPHASLSPQVPLHRFQRPSNIAQYLHNPVSPYFYSEPYGERKNQISHAWWFFTCFHYFSNSNEESYLSPLIISNPICTYQQHWHWQVPAASLRFQLFPEQVGYVDVKWCEFMIPDAQKLHWLCKPFLLYLSDSFQKLNKSCPNRDRLVAFSSSSSLGSHPLDPELDDDTDADDFSAFAAKNQTLKWGHRG